MAESKLRMVLHKKYGAMEFVLIFICVVMFLALLTDMMA